MCIRDRPNFGSQNITTTGTLTMAGSLPTIILNDENNENDFNIQNINGTFAVGDIDAGAARLEIASNGTTTVRKNLDALEGVDVTGNISVSGTVDGVDVAGQNTLMRSVVASTANLNNGVTATTQAQSDNSTKVATTAYVKSAVANVVDSAPGALDTLNELAAALGDDANFATTTANSIGTKLPKSGGQMTGNITMSGSQTVDGRDLSVDGAKLDGIESGATADQSASEILTAIKTVDGAGSGLDADTLDGVNSTSFLRSDAADSASQDITFNGGGGAVTIGGGSDIRLSAGNWTGEASAKIQHHSNHLYVQYPDAGTFRVRDSAGNDNFTVDSSGNATAVGNVTAYSDARLKTDISTINDALGIVGKLRGVSYKWLRDGTEGIGVIAQEVEAVIPSVVVTNEVPGLDGMEEVKSVDYGKIVGVLINAINELKAEVDELKGGK